MLLQVITSIGQTVEENIGRVGTGILPLAIAAFISLHGTASQTAAVTERVKTQIRRSCKACCSDCGIVVLVLVMIMVVISVVRVFPGA